MRSRFVLDFFLPLLSLEVQQPPSAPPHFSLRVDTSLSSRSRRSRRAAKSASQPQDPDPNPEPDGTSLILWVRTRGEPGIRSISLAERERERERGDQKTQTELNLFFWVLWIIQMSLPPWLASDDSPWLAQPSEITTCSNDNGKLKCLMFAYQDSSIISQYVWHLQYNQY